MTLPPEHPGGNPPPTSFADPLSLPADPRDRNLALAYARARGIEPAWAGRVLSPWQQLRARVERLERLVIRLADGGGA